MTTVFSFLRQEHGKPREFYVIAHHHVALTKRAEVPANTEAGRTAMNIIADYPNVEEIEFDFKDDSVDITFENHGGKLTCPLTEVVRKTKTEPYAAYLGNGRLLVEDESWTACQQQIQSLKKKNEELGLHIELLSEDRTKRRRTVHEP